MPRVSDVVAGDTEEGNLSFFNKAVAKVMSKARTQDSTCDFSSPIPDFPEHRSQIRFQSSPRCCKILSTGLTSGGMVAGRVKLTHLSKSTTWVLFSFFRGTRISGSALNCLRHFQLVFVLTFRMATCRDLAENEADLEKISELFMTLQTSVTPTSLMLPWFPGPARRAAKQANIEMYTVLSGYIEARRRAKSADDAIDLLIADGVANENIVWVSTIVQKIPCGFS